MKVQASDVGLEVAEIKEGDREGKQREDGY